MIDAWFSSSETIASSGPNSVSKTPPFASKQDEYRMVASVPRNRDTRRSSSRCCSCVPQMKRTLAIPYPQSSSAAFAASRRAGWSARPR